MASATTTFPSVMEAVIATILVIVAATTSLVANEVANQATG